jgi:hypothetical protein
MVYLHIGFADVFIEAIHVGTKWISKRGICMDFTWRGRIDVGSNNDFFSPWLVFIPLPLGQIKDYGL